MVWRLISESKYFIVSLPLSKCPPIPFRKLCLSEVLHWLHKAKTSLKLGLSSWLMNLFSYLKMNAQGALIIYKKT